MRPRRAKAGGTAPPTTPRVAPGTTSTQHETPVFCFRHTDRTTPEPWRFRPGAEDAATLLEFAADMSQLTWAEIEAQRSGAHRRHHDQPIASICPDAQRDFSRLRFNGHPLDVTFGDDIFRFRLTGEKRLWGFRAGRIFHALWWDPEHAVYPTEVG